VNGNNLERPNLVGNPNQASRTPSRWFNTSAFALPNQDTFGSAGRNVVTGPGLTDVDLSLQKEGTLHESLKLQFRFDVYNCLNHPNFDLPGGARPIALGTPSFVDVPGGSSITATLPDNQREIQVALKYVF